MRLLLMCGASCMHKSWQRHAMQQPRRRARLFLQLVGSWHVEPIARQRCTHMQSHRSGSSDTCDSLACWPLADLRERRQPHLAIPGHRRIHFLASTFCQGGAPFLGLASHQAVLQRLGEPISLAGRACRALHASQRCSACGLVKVLRAGVTAACGVVWLAPITPNNITAQPRCWPKPQRTVAVRSRSIAALV